jgi:DNA helicase-2/ATP-dependent DNA helicase PcrA
MDRKLNPEQRLAVEHGEGPLLIVAGAGTGKTTVVTERIKYLITEKKIRPDEILALTFTEKAAKEMEDRVDKIMPYGYTEMWISTFHSFCDMILKQEALNIGLTPGYRLISEAESILLLRNNIFSLKLDYYRPLGNPTKFLQALLNHFSRLKDEDITPIEYLEYVTSLKDGAQVDDEKLTHQQLSELATAYQQFEEIKIKEGVMDFGDLITNTLKLFRTRENILEKYKNKFKFILVDEFQDTNFAQNELAILLSGSKKNITVVADDDQAIYRWRGAALSNVMQFKNNFSNAKVVSLTINYRSTQEILDRSYEMIQHNNPNRLEIAEKISKKLDSARNLKGKQIEVFFNNKLDEEAESIGQKISELVDSGKYTYRDFAILVRANNHAHPISSYLQRRQIPFQFLGPGQLFQQEEIKDLIAYLKVLSDLTDSVSLFRVLSIDAFQIPQRDLNYLLNLAKRKNLTLFETLNHMDETYISDESISKIKMVYTTIARHLELMKKNSAGQILYYFLVDTGIYQELLNYKSQRDEKKALNIAKFFDRLKSFEYQEENSGVYAVVEWIDLMTQIGDSPIVSDIDAKDFNAVNILTVHSSKGLEFPVVFIVNLVNDRFPGRERREKIPVPNELLKTKSEVRMKKENEVVDIIPPNYHLQEERRLFYVAMTRARDMLFLTGAKFYGEGKREKKLSPFVFEALPGYKPEEASENPVHQLTLLDLAEEYKERNESKEEKQKTIIKSISYSQIQAFDICPLHYKARYILSIPTAPSSAQSFGITLHKTLNDLYKTMQKNNSKMNAKITEDNLQELLDKNWVSNGYQDKGHETEAKRRAQKIMKDYFKKHFDIHQIPLEVELPFTFHLKNNLRVIGSMDRVDALSDGGIEIIDYKTGAINSNSKSSYKFQLCLYALAASRINNPVFKKDLSKIKLTLFYIETGEKLTEIVTQKELEGLEERIIKKVKEIEESDFACNKNILCATCEYKMLCSVAA